LAHRVSSLQAQEATDTAIDVLSEVIEAETGERYLRQELIVSASLADVWAAFTTEEGLQTWAAPVVEVDLRMGGSFKSNYDPEAEIGDPGTISVTFVNYVPLKLLTLQAELGDPFPEEIRQAQQRLYNILEFEEVDPERTRIVSWGVGYGKGGSWDEFMSFFIEGNEWSFSMLLKRFRDGPIDWTKVEP
jgi:uncharacterized protein YndB with AHSA1/START domain